MTTIIVIGVACVMLAVVYVRNWDRGVDWEVDLSRKGGSKDEDEVE